MLATAEDVGGLHLGCQPFERPEESPEEEAVDSEHDQKREYEVDRVDQGGVAVERAAFERDDEAAGEQDRGVCGKDAREQRHA